MPLTYINSNNEYRRYRVATTISPDAQTTKSLGAEILSQRDMKPRIVYSSCTANSLKAGEMRFWLSLGFSIRDIKIEVEDKGLAGAPYNDAFRRRAYLPK